MVNIRNNTYVNICIIFFHSAVFCLENLPAELQGEIFNYLAPKELAAIAQSSRSLYCQAQRKLNKKTGLDYIYTRISPGDFRQLTRYNNNGDKTLHNERIAAFVQDAPYFTGADLRRLWATMDENYVRARRKGMAESIFFIEKLALYGSRYELSVLGKKLLALPPEALRSISPLERTMSAPMLVLKNSPLEFIPDNWDDIGTTTEKRENYEAPQFRSIIFSGLKKLQLIPDGLKHMIPLKSISIINCPLIEGIEIALFKAQGQQFSNSLTYQ